MSRLRRIVQVSLLVTPVLITTYDQIGYVGIVRGCSMQPTLNPANSRWTDLVLIDRLSIRWTPVSRGEVVVLTLVDHVRCNVMQVCGLTAAQGTH